MWTSRRACWKNWTDCQGVERQSTSGHQDADPSSARSAISGAKKRRLRQAEIAPNPCGNPPVRKSSPHSTCLVLQLLECELAARAIGRFDRADHQEVRSEISVQGTGFFTKVPMEMGFGNKPPTPAGFCSAIATTSTAGSQPKVTTAVTVIVKSTSGVRGLAYSPTSTRSLARLW